MSHPSFQNGLLNYLEYYFLIDRSGRYKPGAVTLFALSVSKNETTVINFSQNLGQTVDVYLLSPGGSDGLLSQ